jgi:hypothetical protein
MDTVITIAIIRSDKTYVATIIDCESLACDSIKKHRGNVVMQLEKLFNLADKDRGINELDGEVT